MVKLSLFIHFKWHYFWNVYNAHLFILFTKLKIKEKIWDKKFSHNLVTIVKIGNNCKNICKWHIVAWKCKYNGYILAIFFYCIRFVVTCVILRLGGKFIINVFYSTLFFHWSIINFQHGIKATLFLNEFVFACYSCSFKSFAILNVCFLALF